MAAASDNSTDRGSGVARGLARRDAAAAPRVCAAIGCTSRRNLTWCETEQYHLCGTHFGSDVETETAAERYRRISSMRPPVQKRSGAAAAARPLTWAPGSKVSVESEAPSTQEKRVLKSVLEHATAKILEESNGAVTADVQSTSDGKKNCSVNVIATTVPVSECHPAELAPLSDLELLQKLLSDEALSDESGTVTLAQATNVTKQNEWQLRCLNSQPYPEARAIDSLEKARATKHAGFVEVKQNMVQVEVVYGRVDGADPSKIIVKQHPLVRGRLMPWGTASTHGNLVGFRPINYPHEATRIIQVIRPPLRSFAPEGSAHVIQLSIDVCAIM